MTKRMLIFDFRPSEKTFFDSNQFEDYEIHFVEGKLNANTVKSISIEDRKTVEIISVFINSRIDKEVLESFSNLKLIAARSSGVNHINIEECIKHNIAVVNVLNYGAVTVVQFTFGIILLLVRKIVPAIFDIKKLENHPNNYVGHDLNTLTLGVIGTGVIGSRVCRAADFLGMNILAYDIKPRQEVAEQYNVKYVDFEYLIQNSDIITLHLPYTDDNYHMFSTHEFDKMKDTAYLINTSRGELVNTYALYNAIISNKIQGCALDVGECEAFSFDTEHFLQNIPETTPNCLGRALVMQKMMELPNVIITPHIAYSTIEAMRNILETTMESINAFYNNQKLNRVV